MSSSEEEELTRHRARVRRRRGSSDEATEDGGGAAAGAVNVRSEDEEPSRRRTRVRRRISRSNADSGSEDSSGAAEESAEESADSAEGNGIPETLVDGDGQEHFAIECILEERWGRNERRGTHEALVKWWGYHDPTWEPMSSMPPDSLHEWNEWKAQRPRGSSPGASASTRASGTRSAPGTAAQRRITRSTDPHPAVQRMQCVWTLQGQHTNNEWVPTDLAKEMRGDIPGHNRVAGDSDVTCSRSMDVDEVLALVPFTHFALRHGKERNRQLPLAHTDVAQHHKHLRPVLTHLAKIAKEEALRTGSGSLGPCAFPGYLVLVNSETERIICISKETPKEKWVAAFRDRALKTVARGSNEKQHIITSGAGLQITESDFQLVCAEVKIQCPAWDGHLLFER